MNTNTSIIAAASWRDYLQLCKPRVVTLMLLTVVVAMLLSSPSIPWHVLWAGTLGIGLISACGGALNQLIDQRTDAIMARTKNRPLPKGRIAMPQALRFSVAIGTLGIIILCWQVNILTAVLSVLALLGYAVIYTVILKPLTPQNIVIGGLAGAMPPLLGSCAVTGQINAQGLCLVLIIFTWTPPHFWALAIHRIKEYREVNTPMLPVTHGIAYTKLHIVIYTILMIACTYLPFALAYSGIIYFIGVTLLNLGFLYYSIRLYCADPVGSWGRDTFRYSIIYLMLLFVVLLADHYI